MGHFPGFHPNPPPRAPSLLGSQAWLAASPPELWVQIPVASAALSLPSAHGWPRDAARGPWLRGGCLRMCLSLAVGIPTPPLGSQGRCSSQ